MHIVGTPLPHLKMGWYTFPQNANNAGGGRCIEIGNLNGGRPKTGGSLHILTISLEINLQRSKLH